MQTVTLHTDTPQGFNHGSLEREAIVIEGSTGPINQDKLYYCDGLYYSILDRDTHVDPPRASNSIGSIRRMPCVPRCDRAGRPSAGMKPEKRTWSNFPRYAGMGWGMRAQAAPSASP